MRRLLATLFAPAVVPSTPILPDASAVAVHRGGPTGVGTRLAEFPTTTARPDGNTYPGGRTCS